MSFVHFNLEIKHCWIKLSLLKQYTKNKRATNDQHVVDNGSISVSVSGVWRLEEQIYSCYCFDETSKHKGLWLRESFKETVRIIVVMKQGMHLCWSVVMFLSTITLRCCLKRGNKQNLYNKFVL